MNHPFNRRAVLRAGASIAAAAMVPAWAQAQPTLRFAAVFSDKDIRADMMRMFAKDIETDFKVEMHLNSTLFRQGTELVALQRDNLEMGNISPQDISRQVPAWSLLTSAYLFRDANHLNAFFASDAPAKTALRAVIEAEPAPLTDQELCDALAERGFRLSRRTVAKYRAELGIPSTHRRVSRAR